MKKYCYHYQAEILGFENTTVSRVAGVNVSKEKINGPKPYGAFVKEIEEEFCKQGQYVIVTNLSFLHEVQEVQD
jgi:hypothetical protein